MPYNIFQFNQTIRVLIETASIKLKKLTFLVNYFQNHIIHFQKSFQKKYYYAMAYISFQSKLTSVGHQLTILGI